MRERALLRARHAFRYPRPAWKLEAGSQVIAAERGDIGVQLLALSLPGREEMAVAAARTGCCSRFLCGNRCLRSRDDRNQRRSSWRPKPHSARGLRIVALLATNQSPAHAPPASHGCRTGDAHGAPRGTQSARRQEHNPRLDLLVPAVGVQPGCGSLTYEQTVRSEVAAESRPKLCSQTFFIFFGEMQLGGDGEERRRRRGPRPPRGRAVHRGLRRGTHPSCKIAWTRLCPCSSHRWVPFMPTRRRIASKSRRALIATDGLRLSPLALV